jgi:hypothetical protein
VWFTLPLPASWPRPRHHIQPTVAAEHLVANLVKRGVPAARHSERTGVSVVTTGSLNIWICRAAFSWTSGGGHHHRWPLIDLQETTENVLQAFNEAGCSLMR